MPLPNGDDRLEGRALVLPEASGVETLPLLRRALPTIVIRSTRWMVISLLVRDSATIPVVALEVLLREPSRDNTDSVSAGRSLLTQSWGWCVDEPYDRRHTHPDGGTRRGPPG